MVVVIDSVRLNETSIRIDQVTQLKVVTTSGDQPLTVVMHVVNTGAVLPLRALRDGVFFIDAWGSAIGECTSSVINVIATDGVTVAMNSTLTITVVEGDYPDPSKFIESLIESHWNPALANGTQLPEHACITDVKRINRDSDWILILEGDRSVDEKARGYYKNISYPVIIEIHSNERTRARYILREVNRIMEVYWNDLGSNHFDYMVVDNNGRDVSMASAKIWKFIYNLTLMKVYEPKEGVV